MIKQQTDELAELKRKVAALEAKAPPPPAPTEREINEWRDQMRARLDRQQSAWTPPNVLEEMARAVPTEHIHGIALRDNRAPSGPNYQGVIPSSQFVTGVKPGGGTAGDGTGWAREIPLSSPPGVALADKLMDAQDRRDRAELAERLAKQKVAEAKHDGR